MPAALDLASSGRSSRSAAANSELVLVMAGMAYRAYGLTQVIATVWVGWSHFRRLQPVLWFAAALVVESLVVIGVCLRARRIPAPLITVDAAWNIAGLFLGATLAWVREGSSWVNFMYPYTIVSSVAVGLAYRRYSTVLTVTCALGAAYAIADVLAHHDAALAAIPNTLGYFTNVTAAYLVAWYLRRLGRQLDVNQKVALARTEALARERERTRHARMLHDRALQTLETLGSGDWVSDRQFRDHLAAEALWLRGLVEGGDDGPKDDLLTGLRRLVQDKARTGLHVDLNAAQLCDTDEWRERLAPEAASALVDAAQEALTNVAKHAGVRQALLQVSMSDKELTVSVLDHGCGFDPATARQGLGLDGSLRSRIREAGGVATIDSSVGGGTYIELTVPLRP